MCEDRSGAHRGKADDGAEGLGFGADADLANPPSARRDVGRLWQRTVKTLRTTLTHSIMWRERVKVVVLCFVAFVVTNMDRVNVSFVMMPLSSYYKWRPVTVGLIQSGFFWGYLLTQVNTRCRGDGAAAPIDPGLTRLPALRVRLNSRAPLGFALNRFPAATWPSGTVARSCSPWEC